MTNETKLWLMIQEYRKDSQKRKELLKKAIKSEDALAFILNMLILTSDFNSPSVKILDSLIEDSEYFGIDLDDLSNNQ